MLLGSRKFHILSLSLGVRSHNSSKNHSKLSGFHTSFSLSGAIVLLQADAYKDVPLQHKQQTLWLKTVRCSHSASSYTYQNIQEQNNYTKNRAWKMLKMSARCSVSQEVKEERGH